MLYNIYISPHRSHIQHFHLSRTASLLEHRSRPHRGHDTGPHTPLYGKLLTSWGLENLIIIPPSGTSGIFPVIQSPPSVSPFWCSPSYWGTNSSNKIIRDKARNIDSYISGRSLATDLINNWLSALLVWSLDLWTPNIKEMFLSNKSNAEIQNKDVSLATVIRRNMSYLV